MASQPKSVQLLNLSRTSDSNALDYITELGTRIKSACPEFSRPGCHFCRASATSCWGRCTERYASFRVCKHVNMGVCLHECVCAYVFACMRASVCTRSPRHIHNMHRTTHTTDWQRRRHRSHKRPFRRAADEAMRRSGVNCDGMTHSSHASTICDHAARLASSSAR